MRVLDLTAAILRTSNVIGIMRPLVDIDDPEFQARAARRRAIYTIKRHTDFDQLKADEYAYWQSQPAHVPLAAAAELTAIAYAMKCIHVSRLQRTLVRTKRP